jgi:hypothetical protein
VSVGGTAVSVGGTVVFVGFTATVSVALTSTGFSVGWTATVSVALGAAGADVEVGVVLAAHALSTIAAMVKKINSLYKFLDIFSSLGKN